MNTNDIAAQHLQASDAQGRALARELSARLAEAYRKLLADHESWVEWSILPSGEFMDDHDRQQALRETAWLDDTRALLRRAGVDV